MNDERGEDVPTAVQQLRTRDDLRLDYAQMHEERRASLLRVHEDS